MIPIFVILALLVGGTWATSAEAVDRYVRQGATGAANGTNWTDAYTQVTTCETAMVRATQDTCWVADGTYNAVTFNTAASGTNVLTVKKATVASHGTSTGWVDTYGDGVATFNCTITFSTAYWVFDGVVGPLWSKTASEYGFNTSTCLNPFETTSSGTNVTVSHVASDVGTDTTTNTERLFMAGFSNNITLSHNLIRRSQNCLMSKGTGTKTGWVFEYNTVWQAFSSDSPSLHGECVNANETNISNVVVQYNMFDTWSNDWSTAVIVANNSDINGATVCGNIFYDVSGTNGIISGTSAGTMSNAHVFNNTFHTFTAGFDNWLGDSQTTPSGNSSRNNILLSMSRQYAGNWNNNYNMYVSTTGASSESNQVVTTTNPFTNSGARDYSLTGATTAGETQAECLTDALGVVRGADGTWDRGALEFVAGGGGGGGDPPAAPTGVLLLLLN